MMRHFDFGGRYYQLKVPSRAPSHPGRATDHDVGPPAQLLALRVVAEHADPAELPSSRSDVTQFPPQERGA